MLNDPDADTSVALPSHDARQLAQSLHDQGHGLVFGDGVIDLYRRVARRQLEHATVRGAQGGFQPRHPKVTRGSPSPALPLVRNDLVPNLALHRLTLRLRDGYGQDRKADLRLKIAG
jgi:hypothetical protein